MTSDDGKKAWQVLEDLIMPVTKLHHYGIDHQSDRVGKHMAAAYVSQDPRQTDLLESCGKLKEECICPPHHPATDHR
jgi:hypothetical protein